MAFCASCGAQIPDGTKFCQACGQAVAAGPAPARPEWPSGQPPIQQPPRQQAPPGQAQAPPGPPIQQPTQQPPWQQAPQQAPPASVQPIQQPLQPHAQPPAPQPPWPPTPQAAPQPVQQGGAYQPPVVPGAPQQADIRDAQENKTMAWLSYLLFFIPLLTGAHKTSPFVKFHANQGTVLFLASLLCSIALSILSAILTGIFSASMNWGALLTVSSIFGVIWLVYGIGVTVLAVVGILNAVNGRMKPLPVVGRFTVIK